jgi:hypothetical protein
VPFPTSRPPGSLADCKVCHELFPQEAGAIDKLKASGELKKKQIMNKHCTKCHKQIETRGKKDRAHHLQSLSRQKVTAQAAHIDAGKENDQHAGCRIAGKSTPQRETAVSCWRPF